MRLRPRRQTGPGVWHGGDRHYYDLFNAAAANMTVVAAIVRDVLHDVRSAPSRLDHAKQAESAGDALLRDILHHMSSSFLGPFDREDVRALAQSVDDVVDDLYHVVDLISMVEPHELPEEAHAVGDVIVRAADAAQRMLTRLPDKSLPRVELDEIDTLESEADALHHQALDRLFNQSDPNVLDVIKSKDLIDALEQAVNHIERLSDVVEAIYVRRA